MQATTTHNGETLRRWYVYATDGHRRVVWAPDAEAALRKAWRTAAAYGALSDQVDPAPPMTEESPHYPRVIRPCGTPRI